MFIKVIKEKCNGCTLCFHECPVEAIRMVEGKAIIDLDSCILCGACKDLCPVDAIVFEKPPRERVEDLSVFSGVWVFCEQRNGRLQDVALELLGEGRRLADIRREKLCGILFGENVSELAQKIIAHGADHVRVVDSPKLRHFMDDAYAKAMVELIRRHKPEIVLAGATGMGRSFIPRVAAELGTGLTADCTELSIDDEGNLVQTRPAFGGNIMATILCTQTRPQMATVRSRVMRPLDADPARRGKIINESLDEKLLTSTIELVESVEKTVAGPGLTTADIVVAGGGGLRSAENFKLVFELADALGAAVAATRTVIDRGWLPYAHQVGQTGKTVCPKLYIAIGISGAIQHLVGMQTAEKVLAINSDPYANIFRVADYGLVGDLFEIVPRLTEELRGK